MRADLWKALLDGQSARPLIAVAHLSKARAFFGVDPDGEALNCESKNGLVYDDMALTAGRFLRHALDRNADAGVDAVIKETIDQFGVLSPIAKRAHAVPQAYPVEGKLV